jgi:hypothetical protein
MTRLLGAMPHARNPRHSKAAIAALFAASLAGFAGLGANVASADVIGKVILQDYRGATATPDGTEAVKPIYYQDQVSALDTVQTGDGGATSMQFLDETRFDVGPNAIVKLDDFIYDPQSTVGAGKISMAIGAFRFVGGKMKSDENVKLVTPTATMTIRGTELVIYVGIDGTTEVNVIDGAIDVQACDQPDVVPATVGQRVTVLPTCAASVSIARSVPTDLAALDVPDDIGEFSTAAGGDGGDGGGEGGGGGGNGGGDRGGRADRSKDVDKAAPEPSPEPAPDTDDNDTDDDNGDDEGPYEGGYNLRSANGDSGGTDGRDSQRDHGNRSN